MQFTLVKSKSGLTSRLGHCPKCKVWQLITPIDIAITVKTTEEYILKKFSTLTLED